MVALAAAIPWIASAVGSMLPMIVDSFRSGKSPEEAQKQIAPQRQAMIERLIGSGMNMQQAEAMTDEAMADELEKAQLPEPMNPWLTAALAIGGGIGGYKLGAKFAGKGAPTPEVSKEAKIDTPAEQAIAKPASGQAPSVSNATDMAETMAAQKAGRPVEMRQQILEDLENNPKRGPFDWADEAGAPPARSDNWSAWADSGKPFPSSTQAPPLFNEAAALNMSGQVPGRGTRGFTMPQGGTPRLGMSDDAVRTVDAVIDMPMESRAGLQFKPERGMHLFDYSPVVEGITKRQQMADMFAQGRMTPGGDKRFVRNLDVGASPFPR
jgi:hypothetical protein